VTELVVFTSVAVVLTIALGLTRAFLLTPTMSRGTCRQCGGVTIDEREYCNQCLGNRIREDVQQYVTRRFDHEEKAGTLGKHPGPSREVTSPRQTD